MPSLKHPHKYKRHKYPSGYEVFFCALPDCTHRVECNLTLGKTAVCWRCGNNFLMNEYSVRLVKPHCTDCHKYKDDTNAIATIKVEIPSINERRKAVELPTINTTLSLKERLLASIGQSLPENDQSIAHDSEDELL